jgi:hypothetical protein
MVDKERGKLSLVAKIFLFYLFYLDRSGYKRNGFAEGESKSINYEVQTLIVVQDEPS